MLAIKKYLKDFEKQLETDWGLTTPLDAYKQGFIDATRLAAKNVKVNYKSPTGYAQIDRESILKAIEE